MSEAPFLTALGLMSGTSMDGIDAALVTTDGERILSFGRAAVFPYDDPFRAVLRGLLGRPAQAGDADVVRELTRLHAAAVKQLLADAALPASRVDVVGFHGQTIYHRPDRRLSCQIGDGQLLADLTGVVVVNDFRAADVAAGGQGAPLAPLYHAALARALPRPLCVLNVGGVANVTWIGAAGEVLAFDTGPGNALIDDWVRGATGRLWDAGGRLAMGGRAHDEVIAAWLTDPYFRAPAPKSLDRDSYGQFLADLAGFAVEDGAATLTQFSVRAVAAARPLLPVPPKRWLVCGGGRHNAALMTMLKETLAEPVQPVEEVGWDGDALEAQAFAFLAVRALRGLPLSLPTTTGVPRPVCGGVVRRPWRATP